MSDSNELNNELAEISIVKANELVENMKDQNSLISAFNEIEGQRDRALAVKAVLESTPVFGVTQTFGTIMDRQLERIGIIDEISDDVNGVENLGRTLSPNDYLKTRIAGCESFIRTAGRQAAQLLTMMGESVRNRYVLLIENNASLKKRLSALEGELRNLPPMREGRKQIQVKANPGLFVVNGAIRSDWGTQFEKVEKTIKALVQNYYKANQWTVNDLVGFFGGFANLDQAEAVERFKTLPTTLSGLKFDECIFPNRQMTTNEVKVRNSVELMGGRVFINSVVSKRPANVKSVTEVTNWLEYFTKNEHVIFIKLPKPEFDEVPVIPSFSTNQIKAGIKLCYQILEETTAIFSDGDKYVVTGSDITDIVTSIEESTWDQEFKSVVTSSFEDLAMKYNKELLSVRTQVVEYLTLLINGYINLVLTSIDK